MGSPHAFLKGPRGYGLWAAGSCGGGVLLRPKATVLVWAPVGWLRIVLAASIVVLASRASARPRAAAALRVTRGEEAATGWVVVHAYRLERRGGRGASPPSHGAWLLRVLVWVSIKLQSYRMSGSHGVWLKSERGRNAQRGIKTRPAWRNCVVVNAGRAPPHAAGRGSTASTPRRVGGTASKIRDHRVRTP